MKTGTLQSNTQSLTDTGSANAYSVGLGLAEHIIGMPISFIVGTTNTSASTFNQGAGAVAIKKKSDQALEPGELRSGQLAILVYDGTNYQLTTVSAGEPIGAEKMWPTETPPIGWFEEDGASLVRATYPALFAIIGTMYGAVDGTHFNLPDSRGRIVRVWAHGQALDPDRAARTAPPTSGATIAAGDHVGTNQVDDFKSHVHGQGFSSQVTATGAGTYWAGSVVNTVAAGGNETRPVNTYRMMIIKAY